MRIETDRLILRSWCDDDLAPFAAMSANPEVMASLESPLTVEQSKAAIHRWQQREANDGFGMLAIELREGSRFIGVGGIQRLPYEAAFTPAVEVGWRLARPFWGHGYATECARAAMVDGIERCGLPAFVAVAVANNTRSLAVMERLGMARDLRGDFDHPLVTAGHPLSRHVLYRIDGSAIRKAQGTD